ncbi:MAG: 4-(cytidine 5'-diphospho)-2-C-methyl-D-erythritol kinase [Bacteroidia bacterium]|nr:4-(cytidine 5'-diphospho)-2-C-methyl-D-erythritol kinase [Bacteroidia bacterium]
MIVFPKAKINLGLRIIGKRPDGYHDIETLFYPVELSDALEFVVSAARVKKDILTVTGISTGSDPEDNLVMKTVRKLREIYSFPFLKIHLHKVIPVGAGLGGGSSDAAHLLKAINRCFGLYIDENNLKATALELGSDCPFFIDSFPAFASGKGEILKPIKPVLSGYHLFLLNPGIGINTREAFQSCRAEHPTTSLFQLIDRPVTEWKELIINDFEEFAFKKHPHIGEIKNELYNSGAIFSSMSGSGSTVYGIFSEKPKLQGKLKDFVIYEGVL